jgi:RNA polymerase sigma-70 factor, ECF subfamily
VSIAELMRARLLDGLGDGLRERFAAEPLLAARLQQLWNDGVAAYGIAPADPTVLAARIADHAGEDDEPLPLLDALHAGDLVLACACATGDNAALLAFDRYFLHDIDLAYARATDLGIPRDEFRQRVRERLFVAAPGRDVRITGYAGRGPLRSWVRVTATRVMLDQARRATPPDRPAGDASLFDRVSDRIDPELEYMRHAYGAAVPDAMQAGFASLDPRQRNLLRQRYLYGMSTERIATAYGVHRATAFRWLEEARAALLLGMRSALGQRLEVAEPELDSVLEMLASRIDVSVRRLLASQLEEDPR